MIELIAAVSGLVGLFIGFIFGREYQRDQHDAEEHRKHMAAVQASLTCDKVAHIRHVNPYGDRRQKH